jgi:hypothetical protein
MNREGHNDRVNGVNDRAKDRGPIKELRTPKQPKKPPEGTPGAGERKDK